ncbi:uro-adherence factor A isoform X2 [Polyergus mexicanus]
MADTSQQQALSEPHTNGVMDGLTEDEKSKMRPADIDADMREMERRKRVEMMMNSRIFREELERIIETQMKDGAGASGLLQQISDMMGAQGARFNGNVFKNSNCVLPINDIRGVESMGYAKGEKLLRCKLAAVFRLLDLYGWTQGVGGQITARLNQDQEHFLVNPYGLLYHEVTASSLIKVDMQGTIVEQGTTNFGVHVTSFQLHSTIHAARPDIKCIIHITTPSVTAVSSLKCGLLPIGQESIVIGEVSTHQYIGGSVEPEEREKIARNLGPINKIMLLTNRGALCCGETVEEAFFNVYNTVVACETQLKLMPAGVDNLNLISEESKKAIFEASRKPPIPQQSSVVESSALAEKLEKRWRIGGAEFEALMRMLDNAGFRTGYIYRNPLVKGEPPKPRNDVEVPPAVSSLGYLLEEEELYKQGLWKGGRKGTDRSRWLNSPNVYQKVEILETGTPDPKKITKWVSDGSPTHSSTPVKIDGALQFVPKNTNPKEFKQIQQQIKDYRRAEKISAGPQSHILEGVSWEEAKKMQDATISGTGEQVVLVGAASKGIIQRGFQHNAMVYKTPYAKNPFDAVTDQELDQYKREIERKQKGDPYDESQSESEALSSFNISRATHESSTAKSPIQSPVSVTSETEEESRDEPRVLRIETKQVPVPSQPEVVLSDVNDATTEYLNEMRYRTIERQSACRRDCELGSNCSSMSNERVYCSRRFSKSLYDSLHLENVKASTIAERKKPLFITHSKTSVSKQSMKLQSNAIVRDEIVAKSRYEARRKFFEDLGREKNSATDSKTGTMSANNGENVSKRHSIVDSASKKLRIHPVKMYHAYLTNGDTREGIEKMNGETYLDDIVIHSTKWEDIARPDFVKLVNVKDTEPSSRDIAFCTNDDDRSEEIVKCENHVTTIDEKDVSVKRESLTIRERDNEKSSNDCLGLTIQATNGEQQQCTSKPTIRTMTKMPDCTKTLQRDSSNNEESLQSLNDLSSNNCNKHSTDHCICGEDKEASMNKRIKRQSICTWIEKSMCESSNWTNDKAEIDNTYESYCNDITKIVESIDVNISSSKTELDALPDTDTCIKYNLDSTNMSLIYSLTPPAVQEESGNDDTLAERSSEWQSDTMRSDNDDALDDYVWIEPTTTKTECVKSIQCTQDRRTISSNNSSSDSVSERYSASGSDILELPSCTVLELEDIDGEVFHNGINESANEIIADLINAAPDEEAPSSNDALQIAQHILAEIIESVYILLFLDSSIYDLNVAKDIVRQFIYSCCYEYSLTEFAGRTSVSDVSTVINNDVDNICRMKGFLENLSPHFAGHNNETTIHEKENSGSSAVIEFCTVAKRSPIEKPSTLALNFRIIKISPDESIDTLSDTARRIFEKNSIDIDRGSIEIDRIFDKTRYSENVTKSETETWPCGRCSYCQEKDEESIRDKLNCLTPISEELDEAPHDTTFVLEKVNDESSHHLETRSVDAVEENSTINSAKQSVSFDETYTISEVSSIIISDNDETNDVQELPDILNSSIDCMSYSYDTSEFIRLEKAIADSSPLNIV